MKVSTNKPNDCKLTSSIGVTHSGNNANLKNYIKDFIAPYFNPPSAYTPADQYYTSLSNYIQDVIHHFFNQHISRFFTDFNSQPPVYPPHMMPVHQVRTEQQSLELPSGSGVSDNFILSEESPPEQEMLTDELLIEEPLPLQLPESSVRHLPEEPHNRFVKKPINIQPEVIETHQLIIIRIRIPKRHDISLKTKNVHFM